MVYYRLQHEPNNLEVQIQEKKDSEERQPRITLKLSRNDQDSEVKTPEVKAEPTSYSNSPALPPSTPPPSAQPIDQTPADNSLSPSNSASKDAKIIPPRSKEFYRVGPDFKRTCQNFQLHGPEGKPLYTVISARFDRGFQKTGPDSWLSYRRNYFTLTATFSLIETDNMAFGKVPPFPVYVSHGNIHSRVKSFAIRITALRICNNGDTVELPLIQHTPKRDKGPREPPAVVPAIPGLLPNHRFMRDNTHYRSSARIQKIEPFFFRNKSVLGPFCEMYPDEKVAHVVLYDRIQFTTAGGGGSQVCKAVVQLLVTLEDEVSYVVAWSETPPFTLRNRSPGNYYEDGSLIPRTRKSLGSPYDSKALRSPEDDLKRFEIKEEGDYLLPDQDFNYELLEKAKELSDNFQKEYREVDEDSEVSDAESLPTRAGRISKQMGLTDTNAESATIQRHDRQGRRRGRPKAVPGEHMMFANLLPSPKVVSLVPKRNQGVAHSNSNFNDQNGSDLQWGPDETNADEASTSGAPHGGADGHDSDEEMPLVSAKTGNGQYAQNDTEEVEDGNNPEQSRMADIVPGNQAENNSFVTIKAEDSDVEMLDSTAEENMPVTESESRTINDMDKDNGEDEEDGVANIKDSDQLRKELHRTTNGSVNSDLHPTELNRDPARQHGPIQFTFMADSLGRARPSASRETHM